MQYSVALLIETSNEYARGLLRGILRYQQEHQRWSIDLPEQHRGADPPRWLRRYPGDGIIARIETDAIARAVRTTGLPAVDVSAARKLPELPWVETDDSSIALAGVEHFAARGIQHVAFCGEVSFNWSRWRRDALVQHATARGFSVQTFEIDRPLQKATWPKQRRRLIQWLQDLPSPCGLMAAYDSLARRLLDLCDEAGRKVPDTMAVLGVDDDPLLCQLATPPLSSVIPDSIQAGYVAAGILDKMMSGECVKAVGTLLPPLGIATRQSTDTLAVDDPEVRRAAQYILEHACDGIRVAQVVSHTTLTRRVLESRFRSSLGMTPHDLIIETRLRKAESLLRDTSLTLDRIAYQTGIEHPEYLNTLFRKHRGMTPGQYRALH